MTKKFNEIANEINLIDLLASLWNGKFKIFIIVVIFFLASIPFVSKSVIIHKLSAKITIAEESVFLKYNNLTNNNDPHNPIRIIERTKIFNTFIEEFNDNQVIIAVLKKYGYGPESKKKYNQESLNLAKYFFISKNTNKASGSLGNFIISFQWHDLEEGKKILDEAVALSLLNTKNKLVNNLLQLRFANAIEIKANMNRLDKVIIERKANMNRLDIDIKSRVKNQKEYLLSRIALLKEHAKIARELGISQNISYYTSANSDIDGKNFSSIFLGGYDLIEKQIKILERIVLNNSSYRNMFFESASMNADKNIKNNTTDESQDAYVSYDDYLFRVILEEKKNKREMETFDDKFSLYLDQLNKENLSKWARYNLNTGKISKSTTIMQKNIFIISLGLMFGIIYVLLANYLASIKKHRINTK